MNKINEGVYTIEAAVILTLITALVSLLIYGAVCLHDRAVCLETALFDVRASVQMMEEPVTLTGRLDAERVEMEAEQDKNATEAEQDELALSAEQIGLEAFVTIISNCATEEVERRVYELYASIKGAKPDEVKYYDLTTIREDFKELVELNNLKDFFALVSASMSKLRSS